MTTARLEVGRIAKAHGLRGEVIVELTTDRTSRLDPGSELTTGERTLRVERSQPHQGRWLVVFEGVEDREAADLLHGAVLTADPIEDPDALWVHELIGSRVASADGVERGVVVSVVANPASDLLELDSGALVPARFVVTSAGGRVVVDVPEGLFED